MSSNKAVPTIQVSAPPPPPPPYSDARAELALHYLSGDGLEIGGLHQPVLAPGAHTRYVDRMSTEELREEYPELRELDLVVVDVVDDGERLETIPPESQDYIVANHFLEHCENPVGTIEVHLSKLKPGGVLFYAVPDKRYTFDFRRPVTPIEHMMTDYERGPEHSRREHFEEWARFVYEDEDGAKRAADPQLVSEFASHMEEIDYSIHMHVWTQAEFLRLILACRERFDEAFDIEATARSALEFIVVLRKRGAFPPPPAPPAPPDSPPPVIQGQPQPRELDRWRSRARRVGQVLRNDLRRWRARS